MGFSKVTEALRCCFGNGRIGAEQVAQEGENCRIVENVEDYKEAKGDKEESQSVKAKYDLLSSENDRLQARLQELESQRDEFERRCDEMQRDLDNKELFLGPQVSDDKITERFESLLGSIKTWSLKFTSDARSNDLSPVNFEKYLQVNCPCWGLEGLDEVPKDQKKRRLFARGLAACIISNIFLTHHPRENSSLGGQEYWLDKETRDQFRIIENKLYSAGRDVVSYRELNDWRALTAELLSRTCKEGELSADADTDLQSWAELIEKVMEPWAASNPDNATDGFEKLSDIFKKAVLLSQLIRRQRPCWSVRCPIMPYASLNAVVESRIIPRKYNPEIMSDRRLDDFLGGYDDMHEKTVEFVVSPALYKRGSLGGEHFEMESVVRKAEVVVHGTVEKSIWSPGEALSISEFAKGVPTMSDSSTILSGGSKSDEGFSTISNFGMQHQKGVCLGDESSLAKNGFGMPLYNS
ncbi:hypothetical protein AOQ84DRAFT_378104 [Glonium stellatum]|uniref:Uncharacterized protein n=1 Tax=Glonium stellatum TaxID=574774 RepID=A0A8E2EYQ1_9PEZI|nr:hypothetical protein AOQ84DRAFT_378104 [Glonium stellatum]